MLDALHRLMGGQEAHLSPVDAGARQLVDGLLDLVAAAEDRKDVLLGRHGMVAPVEVGGSGPAILSARWRSKERPAVGGSSEAGAGTRGLRLAFLRPVQ